MTGSCPAPCRLTTFYIFLTEMIPSRQTSPRGLILDCLTFVLQSSLHSKKTLTKRNKQARTLSNLSNNQQNLCSGVLMWCSKPQHLPECFQGTSRPEHEFAARTQSQMEIQILGILQWGCFHPERGAVTMENSRKIRLVSENCRTDTEATCKASR